MDMRLTDLPALHRRWGQRRARATHPGTAAGAIGPRIQNTADDLAKGRVKPRKAPQPPFLFVHPKLSCLRCHVIAIGGPSCCQYVRLQVDVATDHHPYCRDVYRPYHYPPPCGCCAAHNSSGFAPPHAAQPPCPCAAYAPTCAVTASRARRPRTRSPTSGRSNSSRREDDRDDRSSDQGDHACAFQAAGAPTAMPVSASPPITTPLNAQYPQSVAATTVRTAQCEEDEQLPLSELFRVAPSRMAPPQNVNDGP